MTKQEKIREGIARELCYEWWNPITQWEDLDDMNRKIYYCLADAVLSYLHKQGVVIRVKGKLPFDSDRAKKKLAEKHNWYGQGLFDMYMDLMTAGYVPVEPLIE